MKLGTQVGLGPGHTVFDSDPAPSPKGAQPPIFGPYLLRTNGCMDQDATWYGGSSAQATLCSMGTPLPSPKWGGAPKFSAHVYCGQTAGWIKMPLGTEVGLGPDDIMLDGDPALPPQKGASFPKGGGPPEKRGGAPNLRPMSIAAKRLHGSRCRLIRK